MEISQSKLPEENVSIELDVQLTIDAQLDILASIIANLLIKEITDEC